MAKEISIEFMGSAREVGRSAFLVDAGDKLLLDYGVKLTPKGTEYPAPVKTNLDAVILSHAHLDHSGHFPNLYTTAHSKAYMTPPTLDLSRILWMDTLKIHDIEGLDAPFTEADVARVEEHTFQLGYKETMDITENTSLTFYDAGHILGAALSKIDLGGKKLLYTGDLKVEEMRLHDGADMNVGKVDYLMIESCYGDRDHPPREESEKLFVEEVEATLARGGNALVATFAVGRSAELLDVLHEYKVDAPIYFDGMGQKAAAVYQQYPEYLRKPELLNKALQQAHWIKGERERQKAVKQPSVIVTTSGMLSGGPVYSYLPRLYKDEKSKLFLTGYQVEDTPGRILLETGKIALDNVVVDVKMDVEKFDFSAHAGRSELFKAVRKWSPEKVFILHGDAAVEDRMKADLIEEGFDAHAPGVGETVKL